MSTWIRCRKTLKHLFELIDPDDHEIPLSFIVQRLTPEKTKAEIASNFSKTNLFTCISKDFNVTWTKEVQDKIILQSLIMTMNLLNNSKVSVGYLFVLVDLMIVITDMKPHFCCLMWLANTHYRSFKNLQCSSWKSSVVCSQLPSSDYNWQHHCSESAIK